MDDQLRWAIRGVLARGPAGVLEIAAEVDADPAEVQRILVELREKGEVGWRSPVQARLWKLAQEIMGWS